MLPGQWLSQFSLGHPHMSEISNFATWVYVQASILNATVTEWDILPAGFFIIVIFPSTAKGRKLRHNEKR